MKRAVLPLIAIGVLAACGGADGQGAARVDTATPAVSATAQPPAEVPQSSPTQPAGAPTDVPEALKFAAPLVGGGDIELTTLAGRPVLLWFWAPW